MGHPKFTEDFVCTIAKNFLELHSLDQAMLGSYTSVFLKVCYYIVKLDINNSKKVIKIRDFIESKIKPKQENLEKFLIKRLNCASKPSYTKNFIMSDA